MRFPTRRLGYIGTKGPIQRSENIWKLARMDKEDVLFLINRPSSTKITKGCLLDFPLSGSHYAPASPNSMLLKNCAKSGHTLTRDGQIEKIKISDHNVAMADDERK